MTLFSAPNYCGEFDNAGAMMSVDETLMCSFQVRFLFQKSEHIRVDGTVEVERLEGLVYERDKSYFIMFYHHLLNKPL